MMIFDFFIFLHLYRVSSLFNNSLENDNNLKSFLQKIFCTHLVKGAVRINFMNESRGPDEKELVLLPVVVGPDGELRLGVGHDLPLEGDLLADQDGPHMSLNKR